MNQLYPAILTDSVETFQDQLSLVAKDGRLPVVQVDVIDGVFSEQLTLQLPDLADFQFGKILIDLHLMTQEPIEVVQDLLEADQPLPVRRVIGQIERMHSQADFIAELKNAGMQVALSLDIFTPLEAVDDMSWEQLDGLQLMGNEAGTQGKELHPHFWSKLEQLTSFCQRRGLRLEKMVDIGVNLTTVDKLVQAGAQGLSAGSALWKATDFSQTVGEFLSRLGYNDATP